MDSRIGYFTNLTMWRLQALCSMCECPLLCHSPVLNTQHIIPGVTLKSTISNKKQSLLCLNKEALPVRAKSWGVSLPHWHGLG